MTDHPPVFVVDDEEPVRASLGKLLRLLGFSSSTYASAESFLASYGGDAGGCLLLDLRMPGMSGLDLIEELEKRNIALPVIVMTGHTDAKSVKRLEAHNTLGFLEKPFSADQLRDVLARWRPEDR
jgi:FixJ family two-component response regulator